MPARTVVLTDRQSALLDRLVKDGLYQNVSEAMRAAIRLLEQDREQYQAVLRIAQRDVGSAFRPKPDLGAGVLALHLRHILPRARHLVSFRVEPEAVTVLRILHEAMDPDAETFEPDAL